MIDLIRFLLGQLLLLPDQWVRWLRLKEAVSFVLSGLCMASSFASFDSALTTALTCLLQSWVSEIRSCLSFNSLTLKFVHTSDAAQSF
jgi:hypothetical protein